VLALGKYDCAVPTAAARFNVFREVKRNVCWIFSVVICTELMKRCRVHIFAYYILWKKETFSALYRNRSIIGTAKILTWGFSKCL
jgi:hypothetical protein